MVATSRASRGGAYRDRHDTWAGMRWTRWRNLTKRTDADGKGVWSWSPDAEIKFAGDPQITGAIKPGTPGRARYKP